MDKTGSRLRPARKLLFGLVTVALAVGAGATSLWASGGPDYSGWSEPVNLGPTINSPATDRGPAISKDGLSLYFDSDRPGGLGSSDIYVTQRDSLDDAWGTPVNLGPTVNSGDVDSVPVFSRDGHWMFFNSIRPGGYGLEDVYASYRVHVHDDFDWQTPVNLGANINSAATDRQVAFFENDEGGTPQLLVTSDRPGGLGGSDLYQSELRPDGSWGPLTPITELNSTASESKPTIRHDGLEIYFVSNGAGGQGGNDLWVATRDTVDAPWSTPVNLGPPVNTSAADQAPYLSSDGETLFFASNRPGSSGGQDLYMSTRSKERGNSAHN